MADRTLCLLLERWMLPRAACMQGESFTAQHRSGPPCLKWPPPPARSVAYLAYTNPDHPAPPILVGRRPISRLPVALYALTRLEASLRWAPEAQDAHHQKRDTLTPKLFAGGDVGSVCICPLASLASLQTLVLCYSGYKLWLPVHAMLELAALQVGATQ